MTDAVPDPGSCPRCGKPAALCVCALAQPVASARTVLVLQHPQEQDRDLGTAPLLVQAIDGAVLRVGLSWPNLGAALGREADIRRFGVLYLGTAGQHTAGHGALVVADRNGVPLADQAAARRGVAGIIALDGTWAQAKALWWRNPWLTRASRLLLDPPFRSRYGNLRREPRRESLSTLEAVGLTLAELEGRPEILAQLAVPFDALLQRYRAARRPQRGGSGRHPNARQRR